MHNIVRKARRYRAFEYDIKRYKTASVELITRRSLVQILPPQPSQALTESLSRLFFCAFLWGFFGSNWVVLGRFWSVLEGNKAVTKL